MNTPSQVPILSARGLVKRYGRVTALNASDFDLYPAEVLAVIGDNGAGKSSLIKSLCGAVQVDDGEIHLEGKPVRFNSPMDARDAGIETVHQSLALSRVINYRQSFYGKRNPKKRHNGQIIQNARSRQNGACRA